MSHRQMTEQEKFDYDVDYIFEDIQIIDNNNFTCKIVSRHEYLDLNKLCRVRFFEILDHKNKLSICSRSAYALEVRSVQHIECTNIFSITVEEYKQKGVKH